MLTDVISTTSERSRIASSAARRVPSSRVQHLQALQIGSLAVQAAEALLDAILHTAGSHAGATNVGTPHHMTCRAAQSLLQ